MLKKKRFWIFLIYIAILGASLVVRVYREPPKIAPDKKIVDVQIRNNEPIRFAFKETEVNATDALPIVMIHGSPGSAEGFDGLVKELPNRHIIAVDLPGFQDSEHDIPDFSILAHAQYVNKFLTQKSIAKAHFVGFSLGGGVVLHLAELNPELVQSIAFISSIGVQEYELFGNYHINHAVHGLQLGFFWALRELTPHFGLFDGVMVEYSRNFFDTDQRPLRSILANTDKPFLILHGKDDPLVPVEAAREHSRIVPQSIYHELNDNHFFVFMRPAVASDKLLRFINGVESGRSVTRQNAEKQRLDVASKPFVYQVLKAQGPVVLCFFLLLFFLSFINQDWAALLAGVFVAQGRFGYVLPLIAIVFAMIIACLVWRRIGRRRLGNPRSHIPSALKSGTAEILGFPFQTYLRRSRDGFFSYLAGSLGIGVLRAGLIGVLTFFVSKGLVRFEVIENTSTFFLILISMGVLVLIAGIQYWRRPNH
jgi:pimeloyl-ACP methyl ester carboxylesterase